MLYESLSNNYYFAEGLREVIPSLPLSDQKKNIIIDLSVSMLRTIVLTLEKITTQEDLLLIFICHQKNLTPLAAYWNNKYKNMVIAAYIESKDNNIVKICSPYRKINDAEYKVLESIFKNIDAKNYAKKHMISEKTFYNHRRSLCKKLNLKRNAIY